MEACETRGAQRAGARASQAAVRPLGPATRPLGPATRPAPYHDTAGDPAMIRRPCAHLGVPAGPAGCSCIRLVFLTGFRLSDIFESPFGHGS